MRGGENIPEKGGRLTSYVRRRRAFRLFGEPPTRCSASSYPPPKSTRVIWFRRYCSAPRPTEHLVQSPAIEGYSFRSGQLGRYSTCLRRRFLDEWSRGERPYLLFAEVSAGC